MFKTKMYTIPECEEIQKHQKMYSSSKGTLKEEPKFQISVFTFLLSVAVRILTGEFDCPYHRGVSPESLDPE